MILYSSDTLPTPPPLRVAIYGKNLPIEIVEPPGGTRS
jgi:hypothetical protein